MFSVYVGIYSNANLSNNLGFEDKLDIKKIIIVYYQSKIILKKY
jgi:hypothetical protein